MEVLVLARGLAVWVGVVWGVLYLFRVAADVGRVPREQQHECGTERAGQEGCGEESGLIVWRTRRIETQHQCSSEDGG